MAHAVAAANTDCAVAAKAITASTATTPVNANETKQALEQSTDEAVLHWYAATFSKRYGVAIMAMDRTREACKADKAYATAANNHPFAFLIRVDAAGTTAPAPRPPSITDAVMTAGAASVQRKAKLGADLAKVDCAHAGDVYTADWTAFRADEKAWKQLMKTLDDPGKLWLAHELAKDPGAQAFTQAVVRCASDANFMATLDRLAAEEKAD